MAIQFSSLHRPAACAGILILGVLSAGPLGADEQNAEPAAAPAAEPPPVAYDALFRLPNESQPHPTGEAALDRKRWEERFSEVRGELDGARANLTKAQSDLEALAHKSDNWQMAAPGAQPTAENSPVSYKLREDIRRYREDVGRAERRLRELDVEASLAGVPADWRQPAHVDATPNAPSPTPGS